MDQPRAAGEDGWHIWIDTGGTFTDCLALDPARRWHRVKVLSSGVLRGRVVSSRGNRLRVAHGWPASMAEGTLVGFACRFPGRERGDLTVARFERAADTLELSGPVQAAPGATVEVCSPEPVPLLAARLVTGTPADAPLPPLRLRLATTLGTNALLQRRGAELALFVTAGLGDLLRIGTQQRPELFALQIDQPEPLPRAVVEVPGRLAASGAELVPLDLEVVAAAARDLLRQGIRTAAVALAHSYRNPEHEQRLKRLLLELGFEHVSCSAELTPLITLLTRMETAVANAYLAPVVGQFIARIRRGVAPQGPGDLLVMTSAGGLVHGAAFAPKDSLLSGPAGGVVGAAEVGRRTGFERVISFDMGGTSTDVARHDGAYDYRFEQQVGPVRLAAPALAIETVAAGGGSICAVDRQGALTVGPQSAGAAPGPACYGAGGPLTLTDVNLLLGRLDPQRFRIPIDAGPARAALEQLRREVERQSGATVEPDPLLEGLLELANERMAEAIRGVSLRRGYDPTDYALVAFGGAGPQHACGVADRLGMTRVLVPADAGLLSAQGVGHAEVERIASRQVLRPLAQVASRLEEWLDELAAEAHAVLEGDGVPPTERRVRRRLAGLRLQGQDTALTLDVTPGEPLDRAFARRFEVLYGYPPPPERPVELESLRVVVATRPGPPRPVDAEVASSAARPRRLRARFAGGWLEVPCPRREHLRPGESFEGPAVVLDRHSTTVVEPGWRAAMDEAGGLTLTRVGQRAAAPRSEPVELELFVGRLSSIVEQMGQLLRRTALSTNIKERQDFSCALLDAGGELVVNAPHIPVHLGSLGLCVRRVAATLDLAPGDVVVTNHPAYGGSHLPDVTVITPVFEGRRLVGYVASRAHHAEIGGTRPGSMPPDGRTLIEEGVVLPPLLLFEAGQARWDAVERLLRGAPYPSRAVADNLADLAAQVAANRQGAQALSGLVREQGLAAVSGWMEALKERAERRIREALARFPDGEHPAQDTLDDGTALAVKVTISGEHARIDFTGSGSQHPGNLNATPAIVRGVVIYVLRLLVRHALPLNEGLMRAVELRLPPGLLDPTFPDDPARAPAVVGGNVETSQRLVDLLLQALELAACSQGTMNNLVFGNASFGYYETVGGGSGAGPGFAGASGVHTHMTNTRITDVEVLEQRYPVRVERFAIRAGSGGDGQHRGGDGLLRELTFLEPVQLSLLTQRRSAGPCGLAGGAPGRPGAQRLVRADGSTLKLGAIDGCEAAAGDRLVLETPGGGGYGEPG